MKKKKVNLKPKKTKEDFRKFAGIVKGNEGLLVELMKTKRIKY